MHGAADRRARCIALAAASVREHTRWGDTQLKLHLARLVELEYLLVHRGGRGQASSTSCCIDGAAESDGRRA